MGTKGLPRHQAGLNQPRKKIVSTESIGEEVFDLLECGHKVVRAKNVVERYYIYRQCSECPGTFGYTGSPEYLEYKRKLSAESRKRRADAKAKAPRDP